MKTAVILLATIIGFVVAERDLSRYVAGRPSKVPLANDRVQLFNAPAHHQQRPQTLPAEIARFRREAQHQLRPFARPQRRPQVTPGRFSAPHLRPQVAVRPAVLPARITREASRFEQNRHQQRPQGIPTGPVAGQGSGFKQTKPNKRPQQPQILPAVTLPHERPQVQPKPVGVPQTLPASIGGHQQKRPQTVPGGPQTLPASVPGGPQTLPASVSGGRHTQRGEVPPHLRPQVQPNPLKQTKPFKRPSQNVKAETRPAQLPHHLRN